MHTHTHTHTHTQRTSLLSPLTAQGEREGGEGDVYSVPLLCVEYIRLTNVHSLFALIVVLHVPQSGLEVSVLAVARDVTS